MTVIVDTTAWYAYFVVKDLFHHKAIEYFQTKPQLITTNIVLEETFALIHHRQGKRVAVAAGKNIQEICGANFRYITSHEDEEILDLYKKSIRGLDYVDASVVWLARKLDIPIFTFDAHFKTIKMITVP